MLGFNKTAFGVIATGLVGAFIGYCVYFDYQRRIDPDYKRKVHQRRRRMGEREQKEKKNARNNMPPLTTEEIYRFFMQEVHLGEQEIAQGNLSNGVDHLAQAVAVCEQPAQLLHLMQQTLPPQGFRLLMQKVQANQMARMARSAEAQRGF